MPPFDSDNFARFALRTYVKVSLMGDLKLLQASGGYSPVFKLMVPQWRFDVVSVSDPR